MERRFPAATDANPHCGLSARFSIGTYLAASSMAPPQLVLGFQPRFLRRDKSQNNALSARNQAATARTRPNGRCRIRVETGLHPIFRKVFQRWRRIRLPYTSGFCCSPGRRAMQPLRFRAERLPARRCLPQSRSRAPYPDRGRLASSVDAVSGQDNESSTGRRTGCNPRPSETSHSTSSRAISARSFNKSA